jgi:hypothetical protein
VPGGNSRAVLPVGFIPFAFRHLGKKKNKNRYSAIFATGLFMSRSFFSHKAIVFAVVSVTLPNSGI